MKRKWRLLLFILGSLILLLVFATILLPSRGQVVRATTIYAADSIVWQRLTALRSYPKWFPWIPDATQNGIIYYGDDRGHLSGFAFKGKGEDADFGRYELGSEQGDSLLHFELHFSDMPELRGAYLLNEMDGKTVVVWKLNLEAGWKPWWRFYAALMNKMTQPVLDSGLASLKSVCERAAREKRMQKK